MNQLPPLGPKDKFTPEMRILVASLLSMAVIILYMKFFGPKPPVNPPQQNQAAQTAPATPGANPTPAPSTGSSATPASVAPSTPSTVSAATVNPVGDSQERTIVVENALYRVEFSNRGAVVKSWQLKKYKDDSKPQKTLDLVHAKASQETGGWPFSVVIDDPNMEKAANTGLYKVSTDSSSLEAPADVTFTWSDGHLEVTKKFHFDHSYTVTVETTTTNNGARVQSGLGVAWRIWRSYGDRSRATGSGDDVLWRQRQALHDCYQEIRRAGEVDRTFGRAGRISAESKTAISPRRFCLRWSL